MLDSLVRVSRRVGWVTDKIPKPSTTRDTTENTYTDETGPEAGTPHHTSANASSHELEAGTLSITVGATALNTKARHSTAEAGSHQLWANAAHPLPLARSLRSAPVSAEETPLPVEV